jgi:Xaa-Pro aminopeptidase
MSEALATRTARLSALQTQMASAGVELTAIAPTDNLRYLLGFSPQADERACLLLLSARGATMLMPDLNAEQAISAIPELELVRWTDDAGPEQALRLALRRLDAEAVRRFAADPEMRADTLMLLQDALPAAAPVNATTVVGPLRQTKDSRELELLQRSSDVGDAAMLAVFETLAPGISESAAADAAARTFSSLGSRPDFTMVGSGPHGAFPHHDSGERLLQEGDAIVIDLCGQLENYFSDITRMAFIGQPSQEYLEVHAIVEAAVQAGIAAAGPGTVCEEVDAATRRVIADAGYGEYFVHRAGHGLGVSMHEPPWIMRGSSVELRPGTVHSVEPGIYLPERFGVRLEEIVHITDNGCERFSSLPRDVHIVA